MGQIYKQAGVDTNLGDRASKIMYEAAKQTWENRKGKLGEVIVPFDDFSGVRAIDVSFLPTGTLMNINFDGVGTKIEIAERMNDHKTIAYDLFAMVCDDAVVRGAEPVLVGSILDFNSLGKGKKNYIKKIEELAEGYVSAAREANVAVINGEIAELGSRVSGYGEFNYNWGAAVVWFAKKDRMFTGKEIKKGDYLVGLKEEGFRSNGLSLVRKIMEKEFGKKWHKKDFKGLGDFGKFVLRPSKIYTKAVVDMFGGYAGKAEAEIHGVAHITGGGIPGKLGRVLKPSGLGAYIEEPFDPPGAMSYVLRLGKVSDREAYRTWNMGQGMIIITPDPDKVVEISKEHGIEAKYTGIVIKEPTITIKSKGLNYLKEKELFFKIL